MTFSKVFEESLSEQLTIEPNTIQAFELGEAVLMNYLRRTSQSDNKLNTDYIFNKLLQHFDTGHTTSISRELHNSWTIEAKSVHVFHTTKQVALVKVLSTSTILSIMSGKHHSCINELEAIKWIFNDDSFSFTLVLVDRLYSPYRELSTNSFNYYSPELQESESIEDKLLKRTYELGSYLSRNVQPSTCSDIRWHRRRGINRPMSCLFYCQFSKSCKRKLKPSTHQLKTNAKLLKTIL